MRDDVQTPYISTVIPFIAKRRCFTHNAGIILVCFPEHVHNHFINRYLTAKKIIPSAWMAFNTSLEVTILLRSQPAIGERNFILSVRENSSATRHNALQRNGTDDTRCDTPCNQVLYTTVEKIVFYLSMLDARTLTHFYNQGRNSRFYFIYSRNHFSEKMSSEMSSSI